MTTRALPTYTGPQCPKCGVALADTLIVTSTITCVACQTAFEATAFDPPQPPLRLAQSIDGAGPEGATACGTHPGNVAVTSCQRCGLLICSLCEMTISAGTYCPSCFDHVRAEGVLPEVT